MLESWNDEVEKTEYSYNRDSTLLMACFLLYQRNIWAIIMII